MYAVPNQLLLLLIHSTRTRTMVCDITADVFGRLVSYIRINIKTMTEKSFTLVGESRQTNKSSPFLTAYVIQSCMAIIPIPDNYDPTRIYHYYTEELEA